MNVKLLKKRNYHPVIKNTYLSLDDHLPLFILFPEIQINQCKQNKTKRKNCHFEGKYSQFLFPVYQRNNQHNKRGCNRCNGQ